jgi:hypothetical protein
MAEPAEKLVENRVPEIHASRDESYRLECRNRLLGSLAINPEKRLYNNDPLAPVFLRLEAGKTADAQIRLEYRADMSERSDITSQEDGDSQERPFQTQLEYRLEGVRLAYVETGKLLDDIYMDGVTAARDDYHESPEDYRYHLERAKVLAAHGPAILGWQQSRPSGAAVIASLCPPDSELSIKQARLGAFKPHRAMASIWTLEAKDGGLVMDVISLDNTSLNRLQYIYDGIGIEAEVEATTLKELSHIRQTGVQNGRELRDKIRQIHDAKLDLDFPENGPHYQGIKKGGEARQQAYALVAAKPEAEQMHLRAVDEMAASLRAGKVTPGLAGLIMELRRPFSAADIPAALQIGGGRLELDKARDFMDYLRRKALSEYIFGDNQAHAEQYLGGSGAGGIASAGSYAETNNISRDGDCPASAGPNTANNEAGKAMGTHQKNEKSLCVNCPNCHKDVFVPKELLEKHDIYHCPSCKASAKVGGGRVDQKIIEEYYGRNQAEQPSPFAIWWRQQAQEEAIKKMAEQQARQELGDRATYSDKKRYEKSVRQELINT